MNNTHFIEQTQKRIQNHLEHIFSNHTHPISNELLKAMRYAVLNGGKRIRALLVYATGIAFKVPLEVLDEIASAIECIHAFSLIHDDLPAMDNSDLRRGQPSCHKHFNEALAILAGDALQSMAFEIITAIQSSFVTTHHRVNMTAVLSKAIGARGMAAGQALDVHVPTEFPTEENLLKLHYYKTGVLITAAIQLGALTASNYHQSESLLKEFGKQLGLAFQIQDDCLDYTSTTQHLGKEAQKDLLNEKYNFVVVFGLEKAQQLCQQYYAQAKHALQNCNLAANERSYLHDVLIWTQNRDY